MNFFRNFCLRVRNKGKFAFERQVYNEMEIKNSYSDQILTILNGS